MQIYALCDASTLKKRNKSLIEFVRLALEHNTSIIQYRNKTDSFEMVKADLIALRKFYDGQLIINDYIDLVPFCDGLHLGQEDLLRFGNTVAKSVENVRKTIGENKVLGISTHNEVEILQANDCSLDYIGLGAFRRTSTKDVENILGDTADTLALLSKHPVGIIGGVKLSDTFKYAKYLVVGSDIYEN